MICSVFVQGFFIIINFLCVSCVLFMASEKQNQNAAKTEGKFRAHLVWGTKTSRLKTRWGRECLSATKCLFFASRRWHLPDLGMQREGEEPAGFHLGHSLVPRCLPGML